MKKTSVVVLLIVMDAVWQVWNVWDQKQVEKSVRVDLPLSSLLLENPLTVPGIQWKKWETWSPGKQFGTSDNMKRSWKNNGKTEKLQYPHLFQKIYKYKDPIAADESFDLYSPDEVYDWPVIKEIDIETKADEAEMFCGQPNGTLCSEYYYWGRSIHIGSAVFGSAGP